jgi:hypothetical protein
MKWRNITATDLGNVITKLSLQSSQSKRRAPHPVYWYYLDGKKTLRIAMPNVHGGAKSISTGFLKQIQNSLRLDTRQFEDLAECPLSSEEYEAIIRGKLRT